MTKIYKHITLVEILIVIGIISILASLLLPALGAARKKSLVQVCAHKLKQAGYTITMYQHDNQGFYPGAGAFDTEVSYDDQLADYDGRNMTEAQIKKIHGTDAPFMTKQYKCPLDTVPANDPAYMRRTYVISQAFKFSPLAVGLVQDKDGSFAMKGSQVNEASNTIVLWEFTYQWNKVGKGGNSVKSPGSAGVFGGVSNLDPAAVYNNFFHHDKKAGGNYLMGDTSVRSMSFFSTLKTVKSENSNDGEYRGTIWDSGLPNPAW
ncbi:hypothetical protein PQO01_00940 [Lentisphaera marina]|uniref:hypothetical protein n=1 Tax=Lentisphaera marina TaxID=1111041 RepID=UPI0023657357|nr:hypothetical protein [Lentisphaera marina]MDD7983515.1 hypothetical protein [Lentisphaera marina]